MASIVAGPTGPQGATGPADADANTTQIIADLSNLQALFSGVTRSATTLTFTGMNLKLVSESGSAHGSVNLARTTWGLARATTTKVTAA